MKIPRFTLLLALVVLMGIGAALMPLIDVADSPRPQQGKTLTVQFSWPGASAKVVEQNVTSRIEGLVASVKGVESVSSESYFGSGKVVVELKRQAEVSPVKFEVASLLRQVWRQLPEGVTYPVLTGGEAPSGSSRGGEEERLLLTYQVNSGLSDGQLKEYVAQQVEPVLKRMDDVRRVEVTGGTDKYIEVTYNPLVLANYGLTAADVEAGIRSFIGREDIVGEAVHADARGGSRRMALYLTTGRFSKPLEQMPVGVVDGKTVYLNDLATHEYKDRQPDRYFRVNGLNTVYLNIFVDAKANRIALSRQLRRQMDDLGRRLRKGVYLTLTHDDAQVQETELHKLVWRSLLSLAILLLFVWLVRRDWRYLLIMSVTLAANILIAVIAYWLLDIRLHIYSLAGITVSLGMIIDASVVMADHYGYYHDRRAFLAILAALLTTIGSLVVVFWLPEFLQKDLYDFAWIIIINLSVALLVAWLFTPALIEQLHYRSFQQGHIRHRRLVAAWAKVYTGYVRFAQRRWRWALLVLLAAGFGWSMYLFSESLSAGTYQSRDEREVKLHIRAQMPLGGTVQELNDKVSILESFLAGFPEIQRFETTVEPWGATVVVEFKKEHEHTAFPYQLENKVIGKVIAIGGADWSTSGVSQRGFSNSLNLQYRSNCIEVAGYNYDRLYRIAEDIARRLGRNSRVVDLVIETPGHEHQEDEFYMDYRKDRMALYGFDLTASHQALAEILSDRDAGRLRDGSLSADVLLRSSERDRFDLWHLANAYLNVRGTDVRMSDFMQIERREAKNCIPKRNQEYVLRVAFNVLGSYTYTSKLIRQAMDEANASMPVGYRCQNVSYGWYEDDGTQYWLLGLIVVIIFFVCAILFESLWLPLVIISLIPVSFIGIFLTYYFSGVEFGTGGFASMVLLCGLTVNAGIYIVNEYRIQCSLSRRKEQVALHAYVRAYNHKIVAVFLTVLSTVLGLVPFFIDGADEPFWFSFAVGSIGGLLFSLLALVFAMPLFLRKKQVGTKNMLS